MSVEPEAKLTALVKKAYLDGCIEACGEPHRHNWNGWWAMYGKSLVAALAPADPVEPEGLGEARRMAAWVLKRKKITHETWTLCKVVLAIAAHAPVEGEPVAVYQVRGQDSKGRLRWKDCEAEQYQRAQELEMETRKLYTHPAAEGDGAREALVVTMREWLMEHGNHTDECHGSSGAGLVPSTPCDCGWNNLEAALASQAPAQTEETEAK